jgi:hypothetical protein
MIDKGSRACAATFSASAANAREIMFDPSRRLALLRRSVRPK